MKSGKLFPWILGLTALFVAGNAAFFSVFGLSKLFAGATLSVIVMASSLEIAKLVGASFAYRYWDTINKLMKTYMLAGVITLVGITSAGIFGFLSNAYQGATIEFEKQSITLIYKEDRLEQLEEDKVYLKDELKQTIASLPDNYITAKRKAREEYNPKVLELNGQILNIKQEIGDLKTSLVETGVDVGPAIYLARAFNTDIDTVVKFFILILIFVFDPMAVILIIATNVVLMRNHYDRSLLMGGRDPNDDVGQEKKQVKRFLDKKVIKNKGDKETEKKVEKKEKVEPTKFATQYGEIKEDKILYKDERVPNKKYPMWGIDWEKEK